MFKKKLLLQYMMQDLQTSEHPMVNGWTRTKNDQISTSYDASRQVEMFKHIVYSPEYLQEGSCLSGNSANCHTYSAQDISKESRIGKLSNLNEIQRSFTIHQALGIRTSPDFSSGGLLYDNENVSKFPEPLHTYTSRVLDVKPDSIMNQRFMEDSRAPVMPPEFFDRNEIQISSRVKRRNNAAKSCPL